nr:hypothetical protein [uncultured Acetobacterium sp.]
MKNKEIKDSIKEARLFQYEVAAAIGIAESTLCRKLRNELPQEEKQRVLNAIKKLTNKEAV